MGRREQVTGDDCCCRLFKQWNVCAEAPGEEKNRGRTEEHKSSVPSSLPLTAEISVDSPSLISEVKPRRQRETNQLCSRRYFSLLATAIIHRFPPPPPPPPPSPSPRQQWWWFVFTDLLPCGTDDHHSRC